MPTTRFLWLTFLACAACSSKVTSTVDTDLRDRVEFVTDCLPPHLEKLDALIDFAALWRLNDNQNPPDPSSLTWSEQSDGSIDATISLSGFAIQATIVFYSPTGIQQNLALSTTSLSQALDDAATQLRNAFGASDPFMVGSWTITGSGVSGSGALTAIIGGSTNQNELEELRTTVSTPAGGPPANADSSIVLTGSPTCTLTFNTPSLVTDAFPTQEYPNGTITLTLSRPGRTVTASLVFDTTAVAQLTVDGISGRFDIDLETYSITFVS